jgi:hypothetical protein
MRCAAAVLVAFLILGGCTREEARARLQDDIRADTIDIIHARFPCHSPDLHFFGYRFRVIEKGEYGDGDILLEPVDATMELALPAGAESLTSQLSQLASAIASTKKSLLANLRNLDGRAQPSPNAGGWRAERPDDDGPRRAAGRLRMDRTIGQAPRLAGECVHFIADAKPSVNARKFYSHFEKAQLTSASCHQYTSFK